jgi:hypothetical protein
LLPRQGSMRPTTTRARNAPSTVWRVYWPTYHLLECWEAKHLLPANGCLNSSKYPFKNKMTGRFLGLVDESPRDVHSLFSVQNACGHTGSREAWCDTPDRYHEDSNDSTEIRTYRFWDALWHDVRNESLTWCQRNYHGQ